MPERPQFDDFFNPNSMITPGAAGGITMIITNTLCAQFSVLPGNWTALAISCLFGSLTLIYSVGLLQRACYFVINSLIIFVMAFGANSIGVSATKNRPGAQSGSQRTSIIRDMPTDQGFALVSFETSAPQFNGQDFKANQHGVQLAQVQTDKKKNKDSSFFRAWSWGG